MTVDGADVTADVHTPRVDEAVSAVSRVPELRAALLSFQRALAAEPGGIVMAGRDIGTVVLPDADLKIFLDASVEERARRRTEERGLDPDSAEARFILAQLRRRDDLDRNRAVAPLRPAEDASTSSPTATGSRTRSRRRRRDPVAEARAAVGGAAGRDRRREGAEAVSAKPAIDEEELLRGDLTPLISGSALGARFVARGFTRVRVEGAIDAIPREGPVILASNHISNADGVIIGAWLTRGSAGGSTGSASARCSTGRSSAGWPATAAFIPVDRGAADAEAFRLAQRILAAGDVLMVFPEGTRSRPASSSAPRTAWRCSRSGRTRGSCRSGSRHGPGLAERPAPAAVRRPRDDAGGGAVQARGRAAAGPRPQVAEGASRPT